MDHRFTFHILGEKLTFLSTHELSSAWSDWIELDTAQVMSALQNDPVALAAAWRVLDRRHGLQLTPPSQRQIVERMRARLLDHGGQLVVARGRDERRRP